MVSLMQAKFLYVSVPLKAIQRNDKTKKSRKREKKDVENEIELLTVAGVPWMRSASLSGPCYF